MVRNYGISLTNLQVGVGRVREGFLEEEDQSQKMTWDWSGEEEDGRNGFHVRQLHSRQL